METTKERAVAPFCSGESGQWTNYRSANHAARPPAAIEISEKKFSFDSSRDKTGWLGLVN